MIINKILVSFSMTGMCLRLIINKKETNTHIENYKTFFLPDGSLGPYAFIAVNELRVLVTPFQL